jgi:O-antigen/teichoic acid export membrane protein
MSESGHHNARVLTRNAALNFGGQLLPLLLAVPVLPYVLRTLGAERFAVLTLAWTVIGYFGFLDLGLGRASTRLVAALLGEGRRHEVSRVVWSALAVQALLGVSGAATVGGLSGVLARDILRIAEPALLAQTQQALALVALALPLVLVSGTVAGLLEAHQRFDLVNAVRVPANCAALAVPAVGVSFGWSLPTLILGIVATRGCGLLCFSALALRVTGGMQPARPHGPTVRQLLGFGGWLTVSLLAGPVLVYAERLLLGGLRSLTELAYYAVPFEVAARTAVLPAAVALTLFPAFSFAQRSGGRIDELFRRPVRLLFLLQWPLLVVLWLFPAEILTLWMNRTVASAGASALRLLALSFFLNGFAYVALAGVQGLGRPDLKAKLDLVEVPLYVATATLLIAPFGIIGAAAAKLFITVVDVALLFEFARRVGAPPLVQAAALSRRAGAIAAMIVPLTGLAALAPASIRVVAAIVSIVAVCGFCWRHALGPGDRAAMLGLIRRRDLKEAL